MYVERERERDVCIVLCVYIYIYVCICTYICIYVYVGHGVGVVRGPPAQGLLHEVVLDRSRAYVVYNKYKNRRVI